MPEFHFYAIADGARTILSRSGRWRGIDDATKDADYECDLFELFARNTG